MPTPFTLASAAESVSGPAAKPFGEFLTPQVSLFHRKIPEPAWANDLRGLRYRNRTILELPSVFGRTRSRSRNSATPSSGDRSNSS